MLKRLFDLFFAVVGLLVLSLVFLLIALIVKLSDGGPVLFRQQRVGQGGRWFRVLKFRSMVPSAEKMGPSITSDDDPRITRIGRFLRKTKLDELPQLWNVLVGDMSFVGPRPEVSKYVEQYTAEQRRVLALKPGITDPATLEFRDEEEMLSRYAGGRCVGAPVDGALVDGVEEFYLQVLLAAEDRAEPGVCKEGERVGGPEAGGEDGSRPGAGRRCAGEPVRRCAGGR